MSKPPNLEPNGPSGVEEASVAYGDYDHAEALAALEEYQRTGVSYWSMKRWPNLTA